jgi:hypothetical protein
VVVYFTPGILSLFLLGIFTTRATFAGWLFGVVASVCVNLYVQFKTDIHFTYYFALSFVACVVVGYIASTVIRAFFGGIKVPVEYTLWRKSESS